MKGMLKCILIGAEIVGGIWLFFLCKWLLVLYTFIISVVFLFVYTLTCGPLLHLLVCLWERNKKLAIFIGVIWRILSVVLELLWLFLVFNYFAKAFYAHYGFEQVFSTGHIVPFAKGKLIPYLLYGFGISLGPFQYMASKEPPLSPVSVISNIELIFLSIYYFILVIFLFLPRHYCLAYPIIISVAIIKEIIFTINKNKWFYIE